MSTTTMDSKCFDGYSFLFSAVVGVVVVSWFVRALKNATNKNLFRTTLFRIIFYNNSI